MDGLLDENEEFQPRREMVREMESLKVENKALRDDLRQKAIVMERYEGELKKYRSHSFLNEDYQGMRRYNREIVDLLKSRDQTDSYKILEGYGFVETDGRSWRWIT